ncbi:RNA polymerase sigma factor [Pedobacter sp. GR22-6]|uniref:RNA polymerase sigma factor n=1 Tax=Pedobacter sp. GR22-6 TaxID=3127957 RepID=UPI00307D61F9
MQTFSTDEVKKLLIQIQQGNEFAFTTLFDLYRPKIYTTALRITRDEWTAEEILQDTFVKIWKVRESLGAIDNFDAWLYTVARNVTFNALKLKDREKVNYDQMLLDRTVTLYSPEADVDLQMKEFQQILEQAVARLPPKQKATYQLIREQHLSRNETATALKVSPETVKWNLDQAMRSIRAYCMMRLSGIPLVFIVHFFSKIY